MSTERVSGPVTVHRREIVYYSITVADDEEARSLGFDDLADLVDRVDGSSDDDYETLTDRLVNHLTYTDEAETWCELPGYPIGHRP